MSDTFRRVVDLVHGGAVLISAHGYDEMAEDGILTGEVIDGVAGAVVVEDTLATPRGRVFWSFSGIEGEAQST